MMIDYDRIAADYAQYRQVHPEVLRRLVDGLEAGLHVLEVGCGTGNYISAIQERVGCPCWGVDPSTEMLAQVRSKSLQTEQGTAESLGLPDGAFDFLFSVDVVHHVSDRGQAMHEGARVLRPGGRICTVTDTEEVVRRREPLAVYFPETIDVDLARYPSINDLRSSMQVAGFRNIAEELVEFSYPLTDIAPFRAKAFSCLRLIPEETFQKGISRMEQDLAKGPVPCVSRYVMVWGTKSTG